MNEKEHFASYKRIIYLSEQCIFEKSKRGQDADGCQHRPATLRDIKVIGLYNLKINSFQDYVQGGIWQRILWAPLAFALIVRLGPPREVASNFGPSKL